jgi:glycerol-3-phosphate dehydrogenase
VHGGLRYLQNGDVRLVYEALRERQRLLRNAPHLVGSCRSSSRCSARTGSSKKIAKALGSAMWMYDLTGGPASASCTSGSPRPRRLAHMPDAARRAARRGLPLLRRQRRRRPPHPHHRPHRRRSTTAPWRQPRAASSSWCDDGGRRRRRCRRRHRRADGRASRCGPRWWSTPPACGPTRSAPSTGAPRHHPAGQGHPPHRAVVAGAQRHRRDHPGPEGQALGVRRAVGPRPDGTFEFTYIGTTDTDYDGPLDDPQCTRRRRLRAAGHQPLAHRHDHPRRRDRACGPGLRRWSSAARVGRTADLSRRHR